jgi:hypothetical protein
MVVERIRKGERLAERFDYPRDYTPERYTEGMFGIVGGPETTVELLILNPETTSYLQARRIHPTQKFRKRKDGMTVLAMTVRGTDELLAWILRLGRYVKVLRPRDLRQNTALGIAVHDRPTGLRGYTDAITGWHW